MQFNKKKLSEACAAAIIAGSVAVPITSIAATAAGTLIKNLATVTYEDESGNQYSAQSNEAVITVKQVYSAEIENDRNKNAAAGQTVYMQHTLTNTGNGVDTYDLTVADETGDSIDADGLAIYLDDNGNGVADAGEPIVSSVTLAAGESAELVVAAQVPNTAASGETLGTILTATAQAGGTPTPVTDTGTNKDGTDGTNQDLITITQDAVLNFSKSVVLDEANSQLNYTLTISNTGNVAATDVEIFDALPAGTTFVSASASGLLATNGDTVPVNQSIDETTAQSDLNDDGDSTDTGLDGIYAADAELAPGATISVQFTVAYDPTSFEVIKNTGHLLADTDGDPGTPKETTSSNPTQISTPQSYGVDTTDSGIADPDGDPTTQNDGGDDDGVDDPDGADIQTVDSAPSGSTVLFPVTVTNNGNSADTFDLSVTPGTFPAGTSFTYWDATGQVAAVDTNGEAGPDTGQLDPAESKVIMVKAKLPTGVAGSTGYDATFTAVSSGDPSTTPATDSTTLRLGAIVPPSADLRDTLTTPSVDTTIDDDALGAADYNITEGAPAYEGIVGNTVNIPFHIDNNSGSSDAFQLSAGSSYDGTNVGALPAGWSVDFYQADASGNPTGQALNSTQLLPPNSIGDANTNHYVAVVSLPNDPALAVANYSADNDADGTDEAMDANTDGDGDQPIFIKIESANSGASDIMVDAIDVASVRDITVTPSGSTNQVSPGGSVDYIQSLNNTGNTDESVELSAENNTPGWNNNVLVDTDGDGVPDKPLSQLVPGTDQIYGTDPDGNPVAMAVSDTDGDGNPEITVPAGVEVPMQTTVYAPANAPAGTVDTTTITAQSVDPTTGADDPAGPTTTADNLSSIILGQVRLTKAVAYDELCDGTPDGPFVANLTTQVAPGECAIWEIKAENQGDAAARNVVIRDEVTAFTTFEAGSLAYSLGAGATPATVTDAVGDDEGEHDAGSIIFYVGTADGDSTPGGTLVPGEITTVRFSTRVE